MHVSTGYIEAVFRMSFHAFGSSFFLPAAEAVTRNYFVSDTGIWDSQRTMNAMTLGTMEPSTTQPHQNAHSSTPQEPSFASPRLQDKDAEAEADAVTEPLP